jgi:general stress protein 26
MYTALLGHSAGVRPVAPQRLAMMAAISFTCMDEEMSLPSAWAFGMVGLTSSAAYAGIRSGVAVAVMRTRFASGDLATATLIDQILAETLGYIEESAVSLPRRSELMSGPLTELDPRFSDPNAAPTQWDETRQALEAAQLFWIATVRANGRPHSTPLVALWLDGAISFTTGATEQKAISLRQNPHVILLTGSNSWDEGLDIVIEGEAVQARASDDDLLKRLANTWATKWDGRWRFEARDGVFQHEGAGAALVFLVTPIKVLAFAKGGDSHTRY